MIAQQFDIDLEQGSDFKISMQLIDSLGSPISLSGASFLGVVKKTYSDTISLANFSFDVTDAANGKVDVSLSGASIDSIPVERASSYKINPTRLCYDVFVTLASTEKVKLLFGTANLYPEVSSS